MIKNLHIREIPYGSDAYDKELELRDIVLRKPLGMNLLDANLDAEKHDRHIGAFKGNILVGVLILTVLSTEKIKMRQLAVDEEWRSKGIGTELVKFSEEFCRQQAYKQIVIHARNVAVPFYKKLGYSIDGYPFTEINIPHYKMKKEL